MNNFKNYAVYILLAFLISWASVALKSSFLKEFLSGSLLVLEVALLAINTTARTALLGKIKDLGVEGNAKFKRTAKAMHWALCEQLVVIAITGVFLVLYKTPFVGADASLELLVSTVLLSCLIASVQIVYDTANAIMILLEDQTR